MTFTELKNRAIKEYYPALFLEKLWPRGRGRHLIQYLRITWGVLIVLLVLVYGLSKTSPNSGLESYISKILGGFFVAFGLWLAASAIRAFYFSYYFKSQPLNEIEQPIMSFELARILFQSYGNDILKGFIESDEGFTILLRAGLSGEDIEKFLRDHPAGTLASEFSLKDDGYTSATDYVSAIFDSNKDFSQRLFTNGVQKKDFLAVVDWVIEREISLRVRARFWAREHLGRIPGLGKNWSYGQIYDLKKYSREIPAPQGEVYETHDVYGSKELKKLESILARSRSANALIVGNDTVGNLHIIGRLNSLIEKGTVMPELEHKRLIMLDADLMSASVKGKSDFETLIINTLREAYRAGNIILVFVDFPAFISSAEAFGADLISLLEPYLTSSELQIVAISGIEHFHSKIERSAALMEHFDQILVQDVDEANVVRVLENEVSPLETQTGLFFTYPALQAIAECAERYFPDGLMPDKAVDLLFEIAPKISAKGRHTVHKEDILELVKNKTGIPVGKVGEEERGKLLNLEVVLHHRIIGQDEAVTSISNAVRRARSGINNPNRPLASFLFLGPTGVGKTETTKALAEVFFDKESLPGQGQILRLDMSEYSSFDALSKLIGSHESGKTGVLSDLVRDHPYGVLLLDEFEKTTPAVMDLFLQILDEGFFSDASGKKVNTRNLLIIATSNAGSELIWEAVKQGENLGHSKELIIDSIVKAHIFKPELLNRFDGVVVFHPLGHDHLEKIARLQLEKLKARLAGRGINLAVTDDLVRYLVTAGTDPKFGARPMNRAIQDKIEQVIAEKMIRGDIRPGAEVALATSDLNSI